MKIFRFGVLPAILGIFLYAQNIAAAQANSVRVYTSFDLMPYRTDDGQEIRIIHLQTNFCSTYLDKKHLCVEEQNICRAAFDHLKERLQTVAKDETFQLYGCGAEEMHVPSQKRNDALFIEYRLRMTEKALFKQSVPFNIHVLRSVHKRLKDGKLSSSNEIYPPFPIPETEDWEAFRQDLLIRIHYDINEVVRRINWKNISRQSGNLPILSQAEIIHGIKAERIFSQPVKEDPEKILETYINAKKAAQKGTGLRPNYLQDYEIFLQETALLDKDTTHEDFINQFVDETIQQYEGNPERLLPVYNRLKFLRGLEKQSELRHLRFYETPDERYLRPYEEFLKEKGLLE